jgi:hypothetical protein
LTKEDRLILKKWGVTTGMLDLVRVPIDVNLLSVLISRWNPELHIFQMHGFEMTVTLEETQFLCQTRRGYPLLHFRSAACYQIRVLAFLDAGLFTNSHHVFNKDGPIPLIDLEWIGKAMQNRDIYGQERWLRFFLIRFLGEVLFSYGKMRVPLEVAVIAEAMSDQTFDIGAVILANLYTALDRCIKGSRGFQGCATLVQIWFAGHYGHPLQGEMRSPASVYLDHLYPWFGLSRCEQQERIMSVIDEEVDWSV